MVQDQDIQSVNKRIEDAYHASFRNIPETIEQDGDEELSAAPSPTERIHRKRCITKFCTVMDNFPITFVLSGALIGTGIGVALSVWTPTDPSLKDVVIVWIGLFGKLFLRALKCVVLPLVFVSVAISVMDMLSLGQAGKTVGVTIGLYICTTIVAATIGCVVSKLFSGLYTLGVDPSQQVVTPDFRIQCPDQGFLTMEGDGNVTCTGSSGKGNNTLFTLDDVNGYFETANQGLPKLSLSDTLYQGLFLKLIGDNMIGLFTSSNFLGVIILASGVGVALTQLKHEMPSGVSWQSIMTVQIMEEWLQVFIKFIGWIISLTPFAVISLIAAEFGAQSNVYQVFQRIGILCAAVAVGLLGQFLLCYCILYVSIKRKSPFPYLRHCIPALTMTFASASAAATLPITIGCVVKSGDVPLEVANFSLPLGSTINMDGGAIYIVCACVWLAYENGIVPTTADYIILAISSTLGSIGAAPVPSASLILAITVYSTTFGSTDGELTGLSTLFAVDWFLDRLRSVVNVTGDILVAALVSHIIKNDINTTEEHEVEVEEKPQENEVEERV